MLGREDLRKQIKEIENKFKKTNLNTPKELQKEIKEKKKIIINLYDPMIKATRENYEKIKEERDTYIRELEQIENVLEDIWKH